MSQLFEDAPSQELPGGTFPEPVDADERVKASAVASETHNFVCIALHQVLLRIGWIFKTESVIIPAFMDYVGGGPVLRSSLMVFNRFGFSVPQVLFARRLTVLPRKKRAVVVGTFAMALPFAALSIMWANGWWQTADGAPASWMPYLFLGLYAAFFCVTGVNKLAAHALQGKLIRPNLRGRLFTAGVCIGAPLSIIAAWNWLPGWLTNPTMGFAWIFAAPAAAFVLASLAVALTREAPDNHVEAITPLWQRFTNAWHAIRDDHRFSRLAVVAVLFSATFVLFPHYQALGRNEGNAPLPELMKWVCVQHAAVAIFSLFVGPLADWLGNRAALRFTLVGATFGPIAALTLNQVSTSMASDWAWLMFVPIGFTPVTIRVLINYTLEIAPADEHPRYVSAMGMCLAMPVICASLPAGLLVRQFGFKPLFSLGGLAILLAVALTFRMAEPRHEDMRT